MILIISHKGFHPGFKLFGLKDLIRLIDKNEWNNFSLFKKIGIAKKYKTIHYFWGRVNSWEILLLLLLKKKIILHFIGSDVLMILNSKSKQIKTKFYKTMGAKLFVVHKNLKQELNDVGIETDVVEFVNRKIENINSSLTKDFSVLVYVPEGKENFYNLKMIKETAKEFPKTKFYIFPYNSEFEIENMIPVKPVAHEHVPELIQQHNLFVRVPKHDGLPNTIIEALMCSRFVAWTFEHPFVYKVTTSKELMEVVNKTMNKNKLNSAGKDYVLENYNTEKLKNRFKELWEII